jgi:hypothetical protein
MGGTCGRGKVNERDEVREYGCIYFYKMEQRNIFQVL